MKQERKREKMKSVWLLFKFCGFFSIAMSTEVPRAMDIDDTDLTWMMVLEVCIPVDSLLLSEEMIRVHAAAVVIPAIF